MQEKEATKPSNTGSTSYFLDNEDDLDDNNQAESEEGYEVPSPQAFGQNRADSLGRVSSLARRDTLLEDLSDGSKAGSNLQGDFRSAIGSSFAFAGWLHLEMLNGFDLSNK
jgi:hypothetical protein